MANIKQIEVNNVTYDLCDAAGRESTKTNTDTLNKILPTIPTVSGEGAQVILNNTINTNFSNLIIYGKSIQTSTPSKTTPADIVSTGTNGNIVMKVKNGSTNITETTNIPINTNGLLGMIVPSTGNWNHKDKDGKYWLCDVIDFDAGTYTRCVGMTTFRDLLRVTYSSATGIFKTTSPIPTALFENHIMTRIYESVDNDSSVPPTLQDGQICAINAGPHVQWKDSRFTSVDDLMAAIGDEPILYKLKNSSTIKLTDEQLAAFKQLKSVSGTSIVYADDITKPELNATAFINLNTIETYIRETSLLNTINFRENTSIYDAVPLPVEKLVVILKPEQITGWDYPSPTTEYPITTWSNIEITTENSSGESNTISVVFPSEAGTIYGGVLDLINGTLNVNMGSMNLGLIPEDSWSLKTDIGPNVFFTPSINKYINKSEFKAMCPIYRHINNVDWSTAGNINSYDYSFAFLDVENTDEYGLLIKDSRFSDVTSFKAAMSGVQMVYELENTLHYNLTPQQLNLFKDYNRISTTAGEVVIAYRQNNSKKIKELENLVDALIYDRNADSQTTDHGIFITNQPVSDTITGTAEIKVLGPVDRDNLITFTWKRKDGMDLVDLDENEQVKNLIDYSNEIQGSRITTDRTTSSLYVCLVSIGSNTPVESRRIYLQKQI